MNRRVVHQAPSSARHCLGSWIRFGPSKDASVIGGRAPILATRRSALRGAEARCELVPAESSASCCVLNHWNQNVATAEVTVFAA